jgi:hypothetical protein
MKKLMMFAAAMTIVGGAFAACGDPEETPEGNCAQAYDVKLSVKTTVPAALGGYTISANCGDSTNVAATCYRKVGKQSLVGLIYTCDCECDAILSGTFYLWNKKAKVYEVDAGTVAFDFIQLIGKKQADAEVAWQIVPDGTGTLGAGTLYASGFGKWDSKNDLLKSASGNFAGIIDPPICDDALSCDAAIAFVCTDLSAGDSGLSTVAFGTWSIKYSSSKSKKIAITESNVEKYLPDYL